MQSRRIRSVTRNRGKWLVIVLVVGACAGIVEVCLRYYSTYAPVPLDAGEFPLTETTSFFYRLLSRTHEVRRRLAQSTWLYQRDRFLFWRLRQNFVSDVAVPLVNPSNPRVVTVHTQINAQGFNTPGYPLQPPPGVRRIVVLGDSCTFGYGVATGMAYPAQLERLLNQHVGASAPIQVVNLGVTGYSTVQGKWLLEHRAFAYQPDILVVSYGADDSDRVTPGETDDAGRLAWAMSWQGWLDDVLSHSWSYLSLRRLKRNCQVARMLNDHTPQQTFRNRVPVQAYADNLAWIANTVQSHGIRLVFLNACACSREPYRVAMRELATRWHVPLVEWRHDEARAKLFLDSCHPTVYGHAVIAQHLARTLTTEGWL